jgi:hypothetical protein
MSFTAGNSYKAALSDAELTETKAGMPQVHLSFIADDGAGEKEQFHWYGSLKEGKAQEITVKALLTAGFVGGDLEDLKKEIKPFKPVADLLVELEDNQGKLRIKWINAAKKATAFKGAAPKLAGAFAKMRQEMGLKSEAGW